MNDNNVSTLSPSAVSARILARLAWQFSHGWSGFMAHDSLHGDDAIAAFAATVSRWGWAAAVAIVDARMDATEAAEGRGGGELGLRPSPSHTTGTGRYSWLAEGDTVRLCINRPQGVAVMVVVDATTMTATLAISSCAEDRHEEMAQSLLDAIGVRVEWVEREAGEPAAPLRSRERQDPILFDQAAG